jgi:chorismate mutase
MPSKVRACGQFIRRRKLCGQAAPLNLACIVAAAAQNGERTPAFWRLCPQGASASTPTALKFMPMHCRGVRGATTIDRDDRAEILTATRQLLALMIRTNGIEPRDIASAFFTTTPDVNAEFPALVMVLWNTSKPQQEIEHIYLRKAERLRPDLLKLPAVDWAELDAWINEQIASNG